MDNDILSNLLTAVEETTAEINGTRKLKDDPNFLQIPKTNTESLVHTGLTDSSDDEDNRDFENSKYNTFGKAVRAHLIDDNSSTSSSQSSVSSNWKSKPKHPVLDERQLQIPQVHTKSSDVYTDPVFGIRIVNPLISSTTLKCRMQGRQAVPLSKLRMFVENIPAKSDWVVAGVIVHKTGRTSQKGNPFSIWTLSDMHGDLKTFSLFLFRSAYKDLWKCTLGTVVGILNPSVFEKKDGSKDEACLSVDNIQKVMIIGQSKDYGTCCSMKKDGTRCTSFVNLNRCEHCIYHVKQEYSKCSKRSDLQSSFSGRGLNALRNKVLGKNEVFYAGKSFTALPAIRNRKQQTKDEGRMNLLSGVSQNSKNIRKSKDTTAAMNLAKKRAANAVQHVEISASRRLKDLELLKKLGVSSKLPDRSAATTEQTRLTTSTEVSLQDSKSTALDVIAKLKAKTASKPEEIAQQSNTVTEEPLSDIEYGLSDEESLIQNKDKASLINEKSDIKSLGINKPCTTTRTPPTTTNDSKCFQTKKLSILNLGVTSNVPILSGIGNKIIDLSSPITQKHINRANLNALKWVQRNGKIQKENPNATSKGGKKRASEVLKREDPKRRKIQENEFFSQRFKQMMAATSKHTDLLEQHDNDQAEKYFNKLEMKEKMEEKMIGTYKVSCKAVKCLQCKYTSFSAADRCKEERHSLKVFDAVKRFFKCGNCGNRTVSLNIIPVQSCKKCGSGKWERTGMMKEKFVVPKSELSIRGGEQEHINSNITNGNINLLVPDD